MKNLDVKKINQIINNALDEDLGAAGDITSNLIFDKKKLIKFQISNREKIILCGAEIVLMVFDEIAKRFNSAADLVVKRHFSDGDFLPKNSIIISGKWEIKSLLAAERVALNFIQHLSGIATTTNQYVEKLSNKKTKILNSRKTIPGFKILQKYAVTVGGGVNHRFGLFDGILIKDNHIAASGGVENAIILARKNLSAQTRKMPIEIECDTINQVKEVLEIGGDIIDIIMLDNMNLKQIAAAKKIIDGRAKIEVSGGINLKKIAAISKIGVDYISVGALTHSVKAADIGMDI